MNHWLDLGEILVDFDVVDNWHCELNKMNEGKEGSAYRYPDHLFNFCRRYYRYIKPQDQRNHIVKTRKLII